MSYRDAHRWIRNQQAKEENRSNRMRRDWIRSLIRDDETNPELVTLLIHHHDEVECLDSVCRLIAEVASIPMTKARQMYQTWLNSWVRR